MSAWIFKLIWIPILGTISLIAMGVVALIFKEVGWDVPFRWLFLIGGLALIADSVVNK